MHEMLSDKLSKYDYFERVAVKCVEDSTIVYLTEVEIRALQALAHEVCVEKGIEAFRQFVSQFIVYSGEDIEDSWPLGWQEEVPGKFIESFKPGFFNVNDDLAIELM